ncbi:hypothetical protein B0H10DRAFT_2230207 [Mycena sp. CBHHK59/15]|nr:hypothetical protein B0H10DRAFT_2230207 [Mycena sp. CBHHK59/15]
MAPVSRTGLALPLPPNFDFVGYKTRGADVLPPDTHDLADINADNVMREAGNKASIRLTLAYKAALASTASVTTEDVGYPLLPFYAYSDQQKRVLIGDKEVIAACGPLPLYMTLFIATERLNTQQAKDTDKAKSDADRALRDAEKNKALCPVFGTLVMPNPHVMSATLSTPVSIPDVWHISLANKVYLPLHWWSDRIIHQATDFPHTIATTAIPGPQTTGSAQTLPITVLHVAKNMSALHDEDISRLTPGIWRQASRNILESFKKLCPAVVPGDPVLGHTHASEYAQHVVFFANLNCFEETELFPVWYQVEHELRYEIYSGSLFDRPFYESRINIALTSYRHARTFGTSLTPPTSASSSSSSGRKRPFPDEDGLPVNKRTGRLRDGESRRSSTPGSREGSVVNDRAPPACIICTGPHSAYKHPEGSTAFQDGKAHFVKLVNRDLRTQQPFRGAQPQSLCISFNVGKACSAAHRDSRIHACSLCGGDHTALSRDANCTRVRAGVFVP